MTPALRLAREHALLCNAVEECAPVKRVRANQFRCVRREIKIVGAVAHVPVYPDKTAIIDVADIEIVSQHNWFVIVGDNGRPYAFTSRRGAKPKSLSMHRLIMGEPDGVFVDHADLDTLNNRRGNLRCADHVQSARNRRVRGDSVSGVKGVRWRKGHRRWEARIQIGSKRQTLGQFATKEEAAAAYQRAATEAFGAFNCPDHAQVRE
jgi:hypothetical protein